MRRERSDRSGGSRWSREAGHEAAPPISACTAEMAREAVGWDGLGEFHVVSHPVAVAPDVDDMAAVEHPVEQRGGHDLVVQGLSPLLEALVGGEHGRSVLVAPVDELEETGWRRSW